MMLKTGMVVRREAKGKTKHAIWATIDTFCVAGLLSAEMRSLPLVKGRPRAPKNATLRYRNVENRTDRTMHWTADEPTRPPSTDTQTQTQTQTAQ